MNHMQKLKALNTQYLKHEITLEQYLTEINKIIEEYEVKRNENTNNQKREPQEAN